MILFAVCLPFRSLGTCIALAGRDDESLPALMNTRAYIPSSAPFTTEQRAWLNGFLAGLLSTDSAESTAASNSTPVARSLVVLYGSQTGTAEKLAKDFAKRAGGMGLILGRKAFQRPMKDGVGLLNAIQDVYLNKSITIA